MMGGITDIHVPARARCDHLADTTAHGEGLGTDGTSARARQSVHAPARRPRTLVVACVHWIRIVELLHGLAYGRLWWRTQKALFVFCIILAVLTVVLPQGAGGFAHHSFQRPLRLPTSQQARDQSIQEGLDGGWHECRLSRGSCEYRTHANGTPPCPGL